MNSRQRKRRSASGPCVKPSPFWNEDRALLPFSLFELVSLAADPPYDSDEWDGLDPLVYAAALERNLDLGRLTPGAAALLAAAEKLCPEAE